MNHVDGRTATAARRRQETARRILAAAGELFARQGYAATTVEAVASRAGVGPATVYLRFGTKAALAARLLLADLRDLTVAARADLTSGEPAAVCVHHHARRLLACLEEHRPLSEAVLAGLSETGGSRAQGLKGEPRHVLPFPAPLVEILAFGQERGEVRADLNAQRAAAILTNLLSVEFLNHRSDTASEVVDLVWRGLGAPPPAGWSVT